MFLMIFSALDAPRGGVQHLLGHQKEKSPPLGSGSLYTFKCTKTNLITLMKV